jgi:hypothetical protein
MKEVDLLQYATTKRVKIQEDAMKKGAKKGNNNKVRKLEDALSDFERTGHATSE